MITSILNIIDAKIDQVLETLLLNENTRQAGYSIKPTSRPTVKQLLEISKTETRKLPIKRQRHTRQE